MPTPKVLRGEAEKGWGVGNKKRRQSGGEAVDQERNAMLSGIREQREVHGQNEEKYRAEREKERERERKRKRERKRARRGDASIDWCADVRGHDG